MNGLRVKEQSGTLWFKMGSRLINFNLKHFVQKFVKKIRTLSKKSIFSTGLTRKKNLVISLKEVSLRIAKKNEKFGAKIDLCNLEIQVWLKFLISQETVRLKL